MTREDIIRMAQEAAIMPPNWGATENQWRTLHDFATLVAAAEREACAKVCEDMGRGHGFAFAEFDCAAAIRARGETRLFDDWDGGFPYKQKAWNGLTESQVMGFCKEARQIGVHSLLWKVNNLLKQQNT